MSNISGHFLLNSMVNHNTIEVMKYNRRTINLISLVITTIIVLAIYIITICIKNGVYKEEVINNDNKVIEQITDLIIKIPELMINKEVVQGKKEQINQSLIVVYEKSFVKNGTILLFCKDRLTQLRIDSKVYYKVDEEIFEYKVVEKNYIKKQELDSLLRRRK